MDFPNLNNNFFVQQKAQVLEIVKDGVSMFTGVVKQRVAVLSDSSISGLGGSSGTSICVTVQTYSPEQSAGLASLLDSIVDQQSAAVRCVSSDYFFADLAP